MNCVCVISFIIFSAPVFGNPKAAPSPQENLDLVAQLSALPALPKVHYSWPLKGELLRDRNSPVLNNLARITHALSVSGEWTNAGQIDNFVFVCARLNNTIQPTIKCSLAVNFIPWRWKFDKKLPPPAKGPTYYAEIRYFTERLNFVKRCVEESNERYSSHVKVSAVLLDCEHFRARPNDPIWNEGIRSKLDKTYSLANAAFPNARIEWFYHGMRPATGKAGWERTITWTGKEIKTPLSCAFYCLPKIEQMREMYRETCKLADEKAIEEVTPWVSLASGYRPDMTLPHKWHFDWDYDVEHSYQLGAELNIPRFSERRDSYAPYNRAKVVVFYPPPFDKRTPKWAKHFIAYVRGATGVNKLEDLK